MTSILRDSHAGDRLLRSGLVWVVAGFSILIALNVATFMLGPSQILGSLNSHPWGPFVSVFVFDSWGTVGGLAGVVVLFTPLLFGVPPPRRARLSEFFLAASIVIGVMANILWSAFFDDTGFIGSGSSSIAFAAQAIIFALSIAGLVSLVRGRVRIRDPGERSLDQFLAVVYVTLILSTLYFIAVLQPIFTPSILYNWRVHELAFLVGVTVALLYEVTVGGFTNNLVAVPPLNQAK